MEFSRYKEHKNFDIHRFGSIGSLKHGCIAFKSQFSSVRLNNPPLKALLFPFQLGHFLPLSSSFACSFPRIKPGNTPKSLLLNGSEDFRSSDIGFVNKRCCVGHCEQNYVTRKRVFEHLCKYRVWVCFVASRSTEVSVHAVQTKLGLFFLFYLNQVGCFYITIYWKKGRGQKERKRRVSLCLKVLIFTVLPP